MLPVLLYLFKREISYCNYWISINERNKYILYILIYSMKEK